MKIESVFYSTNLQCDLHTTKTSTKYERFVALDEFIKEENNSEEENKTSRSIEN